MPRWGAPVVLAAPPVLAAGTPVPGVPYIDVAGCYPATGAQNVPVNATVRATLVDLPGDVGGVDTYINGALGPSTVDYPWAFQQTTVADLRIAELMPTRPMAYDTEYVIEMQFLGTDTYAYRTAFRTARDPALYYGTPSTSVEQLLLTPCTRFLPLEPVRQRLVEIAMADASGEALPPSAQNNRAQLAARVLYQLAYDTELSALLNPYFLPDNTLLTSKVPGRRSTLGIHALLQPYSRAIELGLESLFSMGALPSEYKRGIADARDSLLYTYQVSAVVVAVLLARAIETSSAS